MLRFQLMRAVFAVTLVAAALLTAALGGCGSSSPTGTSASPATVIPAGAQLYIEATVRPEGSLKANATAVGRKLTGRPRPYEGLLKLLSGPTGHAPSAKEVEPWLGPHAGAYLSETGLSHAQGLLGQALQKALGEGLAGVEGALLGQGGLPALLSSSAQGAVVLDTTDVASARSFLEAQAAHAGARTTSYRGVTYHLAPNGVAEGIVDRFAVIGSEAGLKAVIDTTAGNVALLQSASYAKLVSTAEPGALANAYVLVGSQAPSHARGSAPSGGGTGGESILPLLENALGQPGEVYLSIIPSASAVTLDLDTLPPAPSAAAGAGGEAHTGTSTSTGTTGAQVLRELPGGSWLAIGFGNLGRTLGNVQGLRALSTLASGIRLGSISFEAVLAPLSSPGLNAQSTLLSWAGPAGVYASGSSLLNLQAALVITSTNPARSRAAFPRIEQAYREAGAQVSSTSISGAETASSIKLPSFPLALTMAYGRGKFVIGIGSSSVQEALSPSSTLAGTPSYNAAASALGQGLQPSALIEFHTLSGLLESLGLNQAQGFSGFASAIAPLTTLTVGGGQSLPGGVKRSRLVFGL